MLSIFLCQKAYSQEAGIASYYADVFNGKKMANGEAYNPSLLICAHLTAPMGSIIRITRRDCPEQSVIVKVVDRGPYVKGRIVDLSKRAAEDLGILHMGIADVVISLIQLPIEQSSLNPFAVVYSK
jgi:rare lipoprotein A